VGKVAGGITLTCKQAAARLGARGPACLPVRPIRAAGLRWPVEEDFEFGNRASARPPDPTRHRRALALLQGQRPGANQADRVVIGVT